MLPPPRTPSALLRTLCVSVLALAGCASAVGPGDAARPPADSGTPPGADAAATDVTITPAPDAAPASDGGVAPASPIVCPSHPEIAYPAAARGCTSASDCVAVVHGLDCCGSQQYVGVNRAAQAAQFDPVEMQCRAAVHFGLCDCRGMPTVAQDGNVVPSPDRVAVDCRAGGCFAYVR